MDVTISVFATWKIRTTQVNSLGIYKSYSRSAILLARKCAV